MKKILFILLALTSVIGLKAQERSVTLNQGRALDLNVSKEYAYNGYTSDRLIPTTRDTIDYIILVKNQGSDPLHFYAVATLDTIAGADTIVSMQVDYKMFSNQDYSSLIAAAYTSAITAETLVVKTSLGVTSETTSTVAQYVTTGTAFDIITDTTGLAGYPADSLSVPATTFTTAAQTVTTTPNVALYYRYLRFRFILDENDSVGTGVKIKRLELKFY